MLDYGTIDDILQSADNMTVLRNTLNDDSTDTVTGVDWFQFNGKPASKLYVSGNSWVGFGSTSEHLRIVRRDADLMTLRREEGTLWGAYRFLRIRWEGYSVHNNRTNATRLVWDLLLFDTGDICVSFETIPTNSSYLASSSFVTGGGTISFEPLSGKSISFIPQDETGTSFELKDHAPVFLDPYNRRYLITDATGALYTVSENELEKLQETELTAAVFETYGVQDIPNGDLLITLTDPTILYWHDSENRFPDFKVTFTGIPVPQVLYSENIDMSDDSILGIEKVVVDCDESALFAVSFDGGTTWWSCTDGAGRSCLRSSLECLSWHLRQSAWTPGQKKPSQDNSSTALSSAVRTAT